MSDAVALTTGATALPADALAGSGEQARGRPVAKLSHPRGFVIVYV